MIKILARLADVANNTIIKIEAGKNQNQTFEALKKSRRPSMFLLTI
jgi:DNA-binding XRE family transcriptional regulator